MRKAFAASVLLLAVTATGSAQALNFHRFTLLTGNQGAGGDPGVLYVGGPANFTVRDADGDGSPMRLCIVPAPIDQPNCRAGETGRTISGPAFSKAGTTTVTFSISGGSTITRRFTVETPATANAAAGPYRILAAAAIYHGHDAAIVMRLDRALPKNGAKRPPFVLTWGVKRNEILPTRKEIYSHGARIYGGITPSRAGRRDRHCYVAEARQILPADRLRTDARRAAAIVDGNRVVAVARVTLRRGQDAFAPALLRRAGC